MDLINIYDVDDDAIIVDDNYCVYSKSDIIEDIDFYRDIRLYTAIKDEYNTAFDLVEAISNHMWGIDEAVYFESRDFYSDKVGFSTYDKLEKKAEDYLKQCGIDYNLINQKINSMFFSGGSYTLYEKIDKIEFNEPKENQIIDLCNKELSLIHYTEDIDLNLRLYLINKCINDNNILGLRECFQYLYTDVISIICERYSKRQEQVLEELKTLLIKKNKDYDSAFDKTLDKYGYIVIAIRLEDKINRFNNLIKNNNEVKDESIEDTLFDIAGYCILSIIYIDNQNKKA